MHALTRLHHLPPAKAHLSASDFTLVNIGTVRLIVSNRNGMNAFAVIDVCLCCTRTPRAPYHCERRSVQAHATPTHVAVCPVETCTIALR
jgi:hypothetical protein